MGSYGRSVRVCRARSSSWPLFSALRLQEEDVFLCVPGTPKLGRERRGSKGERWVRAFQLQQAPAANGRGPAPFSSSVGRCFSHSALSAISHACPGLPPTPSAQTCCLGSPSSSLLLELNLPPFWVKSAPVSLPASRLQPCAVIDRQGAPSPQVAVIWVLVL